ncbi:hypothetical protein AB0D12_31510 [Streptomyces sp. NPDC048479]|uniref:hypothetical protein n=1 Tax=Streptomyces sp. NPDC048479 TaxID=3154725 RepID=UPI0034475A0A
MPLTHAVVLTTTALTASLLAWRQHRNMRRALETERAASHLTAGCHERDRQAYERLLRAAADRALDDSPQTTAVLAEADRLLDDAIDLYVRQTPEGGPTC